MWASSDLEAAIGLLSYERAADGKYHFRYRGMNKDIMGHYWYVRDLDLRGKTLRVRYSGLVPRKMTFKAGKSETSAFVEQEFDLVDGSASKQISFQIPNTPAFSQVKFFKFEIVKSRAGRLAADFYIENVVVS